MECSRRLTLYISFTILLLCNIIEGSVLREKRQSTASKDERRIVCFYAYWAAKRPAGYRVTPENIPADLCTHIIYSYARPQIDDGIVPNDPQVDIADRGWETVVELKKVNPNVKIMLSVGGLFEGSSRFSKIAGDVKQRNLFVQSASGRLRTYGFDGLDVTWLYPGFSHGSTTADKANYVSLMKELREELKDDYLLTISVPPFKQYIDSGIDVNELLKYVDFMNVLAYSYHDSTDATVNHHGPLYSLPNDPANRDANVDTTIREYLSRGARPDQLNLIIPLYGVAFSLENPMNTDIGSNTEDEGVGLEESGALIYFELCQRIRKEGWTVVRVNSTAMGPYAYKDKLWVAYDDENMIRNKARYALQKGLGGIGFWTIDQDDSKGLCHLLSFPLLTAGREEFLKPAKEIQLDISPTTLEQVLTNELTTVTQKTTVKTKNEVVELRSLSSNPSKRPSNTHSPWNLWTSKDGDLFLSPDSTARNATFKSDRDIIFSNFHIFIQNHFHSSTANKL